MKRRRPWTAASARWQRLQRIALLVLLFVSTILLFPSSRLPSQYEDYREGAVAPARIVADFDFDVPKPGAQVEAERSRAREGVASYFRKDAARTGRVLDRYTQLREGLELFPPTTPADTLAQLLAVGRLAPDLSERAQRALVSSERRDPVLDAVRELLDDVLAAGLAGEEAESIIARSMRHMLMEGQSFSPVTLKERIYTREKASRIAHEMSRERFAEDRISADAFREIASLFLEPNIFYDRDETERVRRAAESRVATIERKILKGEMIVDAHQKVSAEAMQAIEALRSEQSERSGGVFNWRAGMSVAGRGLLTAAILVFTFIYLRFHRPRTYADTGKLVMLTATALVVLVAASVTLSVLHGPWLVVPIAAGSIIVSLLIDAQLGVFFTLVCAVVVALNAKLGLGFISASLIGGFTGVYSVRRVRHRSEILKALVYVALAYVFAAGSLGMMQGGEDFPLLESVGWGVLNAVLSFTILTFMLPILEMTCGVTTDLTLLELSDLNRPLLKRLMLESPGTYHHSMVMGTLAEGACEAIGANSLLARVQCSYHDIGKINKPEYFVENIALNPRARNPHDRLTPSMSCLILESHVREGVALARRHKLPDVLIDAIREHHGKSEMAFFYEKAKQVDPSIESDAFKYPGPKPQTRETAIVMIADAVEASSRVLTDPRPSRVRGLVKKIVDARVEMGELEECGLTLAELAKIREAFVVALTGMFHGRIRYPSDDEDGGESTAAADGSPTDADKGNAGPHEMKPTIDDEAKISGRTGR